MSTPDGAFAVLSVQTLTGEWADVMKFFNGGARSLIQRSSEQAELLAFTGMPVRITVDWPKEES